MSRLIIFILICYLIILNFQCDIKYIASRNLNFRQSVIISFLTSQYPLLKANIAGTVKGHINYRNTATAVMSLLQ